MKMRCEYSFRKMSQKFALCGITALLLSACSSEEETTATAAKPVEEEASVQTELTETEISPADTPPAPSNTEIMSSDVELIPTEEDNGLPSLTTTPTAEAETVTVVEPEKPAKSTARDEMNTLLIYGIAQHLASPNSPISAHVKELLRLMEQQYNDEKDSMSGTFERARMAFIIAEMRRSYTAWNAALNDYERAYNDYQAMSEELKQAPEIMATLSGIYKGKALCCIALNNKEGALENFSQCLKNDFVRGGHMTERKTRVTQWEIQAAADLISSMRSKAECLALMDQAQATTEFANAVAEADKLLWCPVMLIQNEYEKLLITAAQHQLQLKEKNKAIEYLTKLMQRHESLRDGAQNDSIREHFARKAKNLQDVIAQLQAGEEKPAIEEVVAAPAEQPVVAQEPQTEISTKKETKKSSSKKKKK